MSKKLPEQPRNNGFFIGGKWHDAGEREILSRHSPAHDTTVSLNTQCNKQDVHSAVSQARKAFDDGRWSQLPALQRADILLRTADILKSQIEEIAYWETLETGKPITQSRAEISGSINMFAYGAGAARMLHGESFNNLGENMFGVVIREPIGVVAVITPWNFPFLILCERVPFILASGCTIVVKPSEFTTTSALFLARALAEAGLPDGCFNVVTGTGDIVGNALAEHTDVDMLSFTGSTRVGRQCLQAAQGNFKKLGLEMGGKNPQIVFADANVQEAIDGVVFGAAFNAGQCCVSGSRLVVEQSVADQCEQLIAEKFARIRIGDPLDETTQVGAITTERQKETILRYIEEGKQAGARLVCGGKEFDKQGRYITPTLFSQVTPSMSIFRQEIFGPLLTLIPFTTIEEAIAIANDTIYGLAASVWTQNINKAMQVTRKVKAGRFWVNTTLAGGCELPIGGFRQSGWGRETGMYGVEEYTQIKSVHIELGKRDLWVK